MKNRSAYKFINGKIVKVSTPFNLNLIYDIMKKGDCAQRDLALKTGLHRSNLREDINVLLDLGLIQMKPSHQNGRGHTIKVYGVNNLSKTKV